MSNKIYTIGDYTGIPVPQALSDLSGAPSAGSVTVASISATGSPSSSTYLCGDGTWSSPVGAGTVTSVALSDSTGLFTITGSPITASGTLTLSAFASQSIHTVLAGPSGGSGAAAFRALVSSDIPTLNQSSTGSAASLSISGQTALLTFAGLISTNRIKTVRDAADTVLELGGSYTPTGTWTSLTLVTPALGTPASGTLTNCTGLPAASIVAGTMASGMTLVAPVLGTPASGTLTNCTFPTLNQSTTGSAASLSVSGQTGLITLTGTTSTNRIKTVRDAADTILELGGSYTPTGTWTSLTMVTPVLGTPTSGTLTNCTFPTLNQNTTGSAASLSVSGQTGLITLTGTTSTNRAKTVRDAADTLLELGGSYTPTGIWTSMTLVTPALGTPTAGVLSSCTGSPTFTTLGATTLNVTGVTSLGSSAQTAISAAGLMTKYDGITTGGIGLTPIVFQQNSSLAFGTFNTGAAVTMETGTAGFYRVSFNLIITTTFVTNTAVTLSFGWTDDQGARTLTLTGAALTAGTGIPALNATAVVSNSFNIHTTSAAITYTPAKTGSSATAGAAWVSIILERLA